MITNIQIMMRKIWKWYQNLKIFQILVNQHSGKGSTVPQDTRGLIRDIHQNPGCVIILSSSQIVHDISVMHCSCILFKSNKNFTFRYWKHKTCLFSLSSPSCFSFESSSAAITKKNKPHTIVKCLHNTVPLYLYIYVNSSLVVASKASSVAHSLKLRHLTSVNTWMGDHQGRLGVVNPGSICRCGLKYVTDHLNNRYCADTGIKWKI